MTEESAVKKKIETVSEELKKKTGFVEELQSVSGKDLVQEVAKLRGSLDDAEGFSRDTKKEWAILRSQNIAMEEMNVTLTANHDKMEVEANSLRSQLEAEKSRYRKMQSDLQKELNVAFDENTKLTTLLDGKVPKNLIDSVELERRVTDLNKELAASREAEGALRAQLEELASLQALPNKVDNLMKQVCELTEELCAVQSQRDCLLSAQAAGQEEAQQLRGCLQTSQDEIIKIQADLSAAAQIENDLNQQCADATQQLESRRSDLERSDAEKSQLMATIEETGLRIVQLNTSLQTVTEHKRQLEDDLQQNMNMASTIQDLLKSVQEELREQKQINSDLEKLQSQEKECNLDQQMRTLTEKLARVEAERDSLLSEKEASCQTSIEEMKELLCRVTSLSEEIDHLQETLEGLRQENNQLRAELQDRMEMISAIQQKLSEQEQLNVQQQAERGEREIRLQQEVQQLKEQLKIFREGQTRAKAEADASRQLLSHANTTILALVEQLSSLDQSSSDVKEAASSRLQDSTLQLQESFKKFQHFKDICSKYNSRVLELSLRRQCFLKHPDSTSIPKATMKAYSAVSHLGLQAVQSLRNISEHLLVCAQGYKRLFEQLVNEDLAVFEERRLQDMLCIAQAPIYSIKDEYFHTLWEQRQTELLDKRQLYLQKMGSILEKLRANMAFFPSELSAELTEEESFMEQLEAVCTNQPIDFSSLDGLLSCELNHRSEVTHRREMILQGVMDEQHGPFEELKQLGAQANSQLTEERSKSFTLLQALQVLQGEDLHARLTNPRGLTIKSSVLLEKTKLEEEVKQLQLKITELESLVSSQHAEISKWKSRAIKLKVKSKAELDKPPSPCTPTKRGLPMPSDSSNFNSPKRFRVTPKNIADSPRKRLDSPKVSLHDSPKSRFFDVGGSTELLSRTCPKQFFDNSSLGTIPGSSLPSANSIKHERSAFLFRLKDSAKLRSDGPSYRKRAGRAGASSLPM